MLLTCVLQQATQILLKGIPWGGTFCRRPGTWVVTIRLASVQAAEGPICCTLYVIWESQASLLRELRWYAECEELQRVCITCQVAAGSLHAAIRSWGQGFAPRMTGILGTDSRGFCAGRTHPQEGFEMSGAALAERHRVQQHHGAGVAQ